METQSVFNLSSADAPTGNWEAMEVWVVLSFKSVKIETILTAYS
jgi:hypothetical protein